MGVIEGNTTQDWRPVLATYYLFVFNNPLYVYVTAILPTKISNALPTSKKCIVKDISKEL
ncbi:MAG: hypothetical protein KME29_12225 [Calothrix sp. FI2-JRJ7]|nr:hypothetical protein [Calothrix sp. FI2-JRJ7]